MFKHVFDEQLGPAGQHATGWEAYLGRLEVHLAGGLLSEEAAHGLGSHETVGGQPAVRFQRRLAHPVERVWRAVTDPEQLGSWFPCRVEVDLRPGGPMRFDFGEGFELEAG
ncbi:MAG: SRPBCC domain-containing protein [Pseudonocardiaceae bacterium]